MASWRRGHYILQAWCTSVPRFSIPRVKWVGGEGVAGHPCSMEKTGWVGQGRPCRATGPKVRGDNKQGPVSRDRRGGKAQ